MITKAFYNKNVISADTECDFRGHLFDKAIPLLRNFILYLFLTIISIKIV